MEKHYVQAAIQLLLTGHDPETVLQNMQTVLERKGHGKLYHRILRILCREFKTAQKPYVAQVVIADADKQPILQRDIEQHLKQLDALSTYQLTTNKKQIGGIKTTFQHRQIDASHKTQLLKIYEQLLVN